VTTPSSIIDRGATITFRVVNDGEPHNVLPALAALLIDADRRRKKQRQAQQQVEQAGDGGEGRP
jgi:hypothetical protein